MTNLTKEQCLVLRAFVQLKAHARKSALITPIANKIYFNGVGSVNFSFNETLYNDTVETLVNIKLLKRNKAGAVQAVFSYDQTLDMVRESEKTFSY